MNQRPLPLLGLSLLMLLTGLRSEAATLVQYPFASGADTPGTTAGNVSASGVSVNNLGTVGTDAGFSASAGNAFVRSTVTAATQNDAVNNNNSFSFTLAPNSGSELDLSHFAINVGNQVGSGTFTSSFFLRSSRDGFASDIPILSATGAGISFSGGLATRTTSTNGTTTGNLITLDLSGALYQNITTTTTFRIYVIDASSVSGAISRFDNVLVDGTIVSVPEPSTWALAALGGMLLARRRR